MYKINARIVIHSEFRQTPLKVHKLVFSGNRGDRNAHDGG